MMKRILAFAALVALGVDSGHCQTPVSQPAFEAASVKQCEPGTPEPPGQRMGMFKFTYPGGRFEARATTVEFLLEWAYSILPLQHSRGPAWMENDRFDIIAKAAGNATDDDMKRMMQTLLADRFKLKFHRESREGPVVVLSLGKTTPKLFPPKEGEANALRVVPQNDGTDKVIGWHVVATRYSFAQLNQTFARQLERVIVNETGLNGDYDFSLDFAPDENRPNPLDPTFIMSAMRDQLGLTVKSQRGPVDYLVIDGAEKAEAGN